MDLRTHQISLSGALQRVLGRAGHFQHHLRRLCRAHPPRRSRKRRGVVESAKAGRPEIAIDYRVVWPDGSVHLTTSRASSSTRQVRPRGSSLRSWTSPSASESRRRLGGQKEVLQKVVDNAPLAITFDENGRLPGEPGLGAPVRLDVEGALELKLEVYAKLLPTPPRAREGSALHGGGNG